ncbi:predicted protein [Postia placenta Mad-698-R]|nr:predicted protein [Postia placenta Mad-698-R]
MSSDAEYNIYGVITGTLGVIGLIPVLLALVHSQTPRIKLRNLDQTLEETEVLLTSVSEKETQQIKGIISGLSYRISVLCKEVAVLRADIVTTTDEERKRLQRLRESGVNVGNVSQLDEECPREPHNSEPSARQNVAVAHDSRPPQLARRGSIVSTTSTLVSCSGHEDAHLLPVTTWILAPSAR